MAPYVLQLVKENCDQVKLDSESLEETDTVKILSFPDHITSVCLCALGRLRENAERIQKSKRDRILTLEPMYLHERLLLREEVALRDTCQRRRLFPRVALSTAERHSNAREREQMHLNNESTDNAGRMWETEL
ncbi:hypothetical protein J6590_065328 [Homalodisca vitripennis]|nr:hypothetical protein J6590_065328 [Homalodisca vitripennis]